MIELKNAVIGYGKKTLLSDINLKIPINEVTCILGKNGIGKTTLFRTILGFNKPISGEILINGKPRTEFTKKELGKIIAYVPQKSSITFDFKVLEVVAMGRSLLKGGLSSLSKDDYEKAYENLELLNIAYLCNKTFNRLSGGEASMVLIARAITQNPKIIFMDEPTANLDFSNQVNVIKAILKLNKMGMGILTVSHNPTAELLCCKNGILVKDDRSIVVGNIKDVITRENLQEVYKVKVDILEKIIENGDTVKSCLPLLN